MIKARGLKRKYVIGKLSRGGQVLLDDRWNWYASVVVIQLRARRLRRMWAKNGVFYD